MGKYQPQTCFKLTKWSEIANCNEEKSSAAEEGSYLCTEHQQLKMWSRLYYSMVWVIWLKIISKIDIQWSAISHDHPSTDLDLGLGERTSGGLCVLNFLSGFFQINFGWIWRLVKTSDSFVMLWHGFFLQDALLSFWSRLLLCRGHIILADGFI